MPEIIGEVTGLNYYPIKSCQPATIDGQLTTELSVGVTGFTAYGVPDRGFVLFNAFDGTFISRRGWDKAETMKYPEDPRVLSGVAVDITPGVMNVSYRDGSSIAIPTEASDGPETRVRIFKSVYAGYDVGDEPAAFFSEILRADVRLAGFHPQMPARHVAADYLHEQAVNETAASDGFPFLLVNQTSLDDAHALNELDKDIQPLAAYRGNIEISTQAPWVEDEVRVITIGESFEAFVAKSCSRCPIPNQDVETGVQTGASNKVLRSVRTGWKVTDDRSERPKIYFGQNLNHSVSSIDSVIKVGDEVVGVEFGPPNFVPRR